VWNDALFYWRRNWWIWNSFVSSSIPHWQCSKQTPVEGALLCWSFNLLPIFQPRSVSFPYFRVWMLTLIGETCRWSETTSFLLGFSTCRATNRFLQRELCHDEVWCLLMFYLDRVWLFNLLQCFASATGGRKFCSVWKCCIPSCISHLQSHKRVFVERALPRQSSMTAHVFRLGLTFRPTAVFRCWNWWDKVL
jgi:hypothetical protein